MIKGWGISDLFQVGLLSILPHLSSVIGTVLVGRALQSTVALCLCVAVAALGLLPMTLAQGIAFAVLRLTIAGV